MENVVKTARAEAKTVRISARKVRLVIDLVRGKNIGDAFSILHLTPNGASSVVAKVLKSAVANAEHNLIRELAEQGDCVIIGRAADVILKEYNPLDYDETIKKRIAHEEFTLAIVQNDWKKIRTYKNSDEWKEYSFTEKFNIFLTCTNTTKNTNFFYSF